MKNHFILLFSIVFSFQLRGQDIHNNPYLQIVKKDGIVSVDPTNGLVKKRFESLMTQISSSNKDKQKAAGNAVQKQKLDSTFSSYINYPELRDKTYFSYNHLGKETLFISTAWDDSAKAYLNISKVETFYNVNGSIALSVFSLGIGTGWINSNKQEAIYNSSNQLISSISYQWNSIKKIWENNLKDDLTYDGKGNVVLALAYEWSVSKNQWLNYSKVELVYDSRDNVLLKTFYIWNNQWFFDAREESTFNSFDKEIAFVSLIWDNNEGDWINTFKFTYEFNSKQYLINTTDYFWDEGIGWSPTDKVDYTYDKNDNMIYFISYKIENLKWNAFFKGECTYNNQYSHDDLIISNHSGLENEIYFHHMLTKLGYFEYNSGNWFNSDNVLYYYSAINISKTKEYAKRDVRILPNPASSFFTIEGQEGIEMNFSLFDLNGKELISSFIKANESIPTYNLSKGLYCYKIIVDNRYAQNGKLFIE